MVASSSVGNGAGIFATVAACTTSLIGHWAVAERRSRLVWLLNLYLAEYWGDQNTLCSASQVTVDSKCFDCAEG